MRSYARSRLGDLLLCLAMSVSLIYTIASGFVLNDVWSGQPAVVTALSLVVLLMLFIAAYRRILTWVAIGLACVGGIWTVFYMQTYHPLADETANSTFLYLLITLLTVVLVFLLGRSRVGIVALFVIGNLIGAGAHFLQFPAPLWNQLLFAAAALALLFYRGYLVALLTTALGKVAPIRYWVQGIVLCVVALGLASGIYVGIVAPLNPPTQELKLITVLKSMDSLRVLGVSTTRVVLDTEQTSDQPPEQTQHSNMAGETPDESQTPATATSPEEENPPADEEDITDQQQEELAAVSYDDEVTHFGWLLLLLIPLGIGGCYGIHFWQRKKWHRAVQALDRETAVLNYYTFFLKRLSRLGIKRPEGHTLHQFALESAGETAPFDHDASTFLRLTEIYQTVFYGQHLVTEEELQCFAAFYDRFYPTLRKQLRTVPYLLRYFQF